MSNMPNPDKIIFTATFPSRKKINIPPKILFVLYYIAAVILFLATFDTYESYFTYTYIWGMDTEYNKAEIFFVTVAVIILPFIIKLIIKLLSKFSRSIKNNLYITESAVCGNIKSGLLTKEVKIPIDKIGTVSLVSNWFEKRAGIKRVFITSGSGSIHFMGITNGEEFVNAIFTQIEKRKFGKCESNDVANTEE